jgi:hypothetical protein
MSDNVNKLITSVNHGLFVGVTGDRSRLVAMREALMSRKSIPETDEKE